MAAMIRSRTVPPTRSQLASGAWEWPPEGSASMRKVASPAQRMVAASHSRGLASRGHEGRDCGPTPSGTSGSLDTSWLSGNPDSVNKENDLWNEWRRLTKQTAPDPLEVAKLA